MTLQEIRTPPFFSDIQTFCTYVIREDKFLHFYLGRTSMLCSCPQNWLRNKRTTYRNRNPNCCPVGASCFCDGFMIRQKYIHFVEDYLLNIPTTFCSNWSSGSREEGRYIQVYRLWRRTQSDDNTPTLLSGSSSKKTTFFTVDSLMLHNKNICLYVLVI